MTMANHLSKQNRGPSVILAALPGEKAGLPQCPGWKSTVWFMRQELNRT